MSEIPFLAVRPMAYVSNKAGQTLKAGTTLYAGGHFYDPDSGNEVQQDPTDTTVFVHVHITFQLKEDVVLDEGAFVVGVTAR